MLRGLSGNADLKIGVFAFPASLCPKFFVRNTYKTCTILGQIRPRKLFKMNTSLTYTK